MSTGKSGSSSIRKCVKKCDRKFNIKEVKEVKNDLSGKKTSDQGDRPYEQHISLRKEEKVLIDTHGDKPSHTQRYENVKSSAKLKRECRSKFVGTELCSKHNLKKRISKKRSFVTKSKRVKKKLPCLAEGKNQGYSDAKCFWTECRSHKRHSVSSKEKCNTNLKLKSQSSSRRSVMKNQCSQQKIDNFLHLPVEIICNIFRFLTLVEILCLECLSRKIQEAVLHYLQNVRSIDFNEHTECRKLFEHNLSVLSDFTFSSLLKKLPNLQNIYNFHPGNLKLNGSSNLNELTIAGVCSTLAKCDTLQGIELSSLDLLQALGKSSYNVKIIGKFQNGTSSVVEPTHITLKDEMKISHLHLTDCSMYNLPQMDSYLEHLYLRNVKFVYGHPFMDFSAFKLKSFVMSQCVGPRLPMKYLPLLSALADAFRLKRLELQDIPYLGGIIKHVSEITWRKGSFRRLESLVIGNCNNIQNGDVGYLVISAACRIETLRLQPSLTKDAIFYALVAAEVTVNPGFQELCLGWQDDTDQSGLGGVSDSSNAQCCLTDSGMRIVGQCFPSVKKLEVRSSPYIRDPINWFTPGQQYWKNLEELCLCNCQCLNVEWFADFLTLLPNLKFLTLQKMFKEPPLGCSRVGLAAGTGIGAVTSFENNGVEDNIYIVSDRNHDIDNNDNMNLDLGVNPHNENAAVNHVIENEANENGAENPEMEHVANQNGAWNHETEQLVDENAALNPETDNIANKNVHNENNTTEQASERLPNSGYNLRYSSRASSTSVGDGDDSLKEKPRSRKRKCERSTDFDMPDSSVVKSVNVHSSSKRLAVSKRGKALVTKNGIISKAKSSFKKRIHKRKCHEPTMLNKSPVQTQHKERVCTCSKQTSEIGCQVSTRDIRKSFKHSCAGKRITRKNSNSTEKVIEPRVYKPASSNVSRQDEDVCVIHRDRLCMRDQSDGTSDPVWEDDYKQILNISHSRLEYLKLDDVGVSDLNIECSKLVTLSVSRCTVLKNIQLLATPYLGNVHISQCRAFDEEHFMDQIYRLPTNCSKFISLRPLHHLDEKLFNKLQYSDDKQSYNFGTMMMFDYSDKPSETNYNKLRMKSWIRMLERMTTVSMAQFGFSNFLEMKEPNKKVNFMNGQSTNGSKWSLFSDIPWIELLNQCPNIEDKYLTNPEWRKEGVYCMESKGNFSFWDAYTDIQDSIQSLRSHNIGLYNCNILTYINLCDISGSPSLDGLNVL